MNPDYHIGKFREPGMDFLRLQSMCDKILASGENPPLIVDNMVLITRPGDNGSQNGFRAATCLEDNRRTMLVDGKPANDINWMMRILPEVAKYFGLNRDDVLQWWVQDYGLAAVFRHDPSLCTR